MLEFGKFRVENYDGKTKPMKMEPEFAAKPDRSKKLFANEVSVMIALWGGPEAFCIRLSGRYYYRKSFV